MKIIIKHILRNITKHWLATLLIVFSLAISSGVVYVALNISNDVLSVSRSLIERTFGGYDLVAYSTEVGYQFNEEEFEGIDIIPVVSGTSEDKAIKDFLGNYTAVFLVDVKGNQDGFIETFTKDHSDLQLIKIDERIDFDSQM